MTNYTEIKIIYNSPCYPPEGITMNKTYAIIKKDNVFYITDNETEIPIEEQVIKMLFVPQGDIEWDEVDFENKIEKITEDYV